MKKFSRTRVRWAALGVLATSVALPFGAQAQDEEELEAYTITGSRIPRLALEGPSPVLQLSRDSLDASGYSNVGDALRSLPFNTGQSLTPIDSGTSFTPGVSTLNLRGMGNNNVLVLVNGRRAAPFGASGFNGFQTLFDFNSIPAAAIESVEVLKDGASAIYGSDAVSGVVNIKLRQDFEGLSTELGVGNTFSTDSFEKRLFVIAGARTARTSIVTTADWYERNAIFARDLKFARNADLRDVGGIDRRSTAGMPGLVYVDSLEGYYTFPERTSNPTAAGAVPFGTDLGGGRTAGMYNFLEDSDFFPKTRQYGFYTSVRHDITDNITIGTEVSFRRAESSAQSAPTPMFNFNEQGFYYDLMTEDELGVEPDPTNRNHYRPGQIPYDIIIPAYNPYNPWGEELHWDNRVRFTDVGNRINDVISDTPRLLLTLEGKIGEDWIWETGALYTRNVYSNNNLGSIQDYLLQEAFHGITLNPGTPEEETLYLNPFGPSDPRVIDYISISNPVTSRYEVISYDFNVAGPIFDLPAGPVGLAVGAEYREEKLDDRRTALNETGQIVGGSEGSSITGSRDVAAVYGELSVPVAPILDLQFAVRHEDYSDFGNTTKPKVAALLRPLPGVILRGSYGQSFLAPNLPFLYSAQSTSFTSAALIDPRRPDDAARQVKMLGGGNPDLQPETTKSYFVGIAYSPDQGPLNGLYVGFDVIIHDSSNLIDRFDAQFLLENEMDPQFTRFVVRNPPAAGEDVGLINFVRTTWENLETSYYRGYDFDIRYDLMTDTMGRFRFQTLLTYEDKYEFSGTNFAGTRLRPQWRGTFSTNWTRGDWGAAVYVTYIGSRDGTGQQNAAGAQVTNERYASQTLVNPQVSYSGLFDTKITIGVRNIFNRTPPLDYGDATRHTPGVNYPEPAFWYARVSRDF